MNLSTEADKKLNFICMIKGITIDEYVSSLLENHLQDIKLEDVMGDIENIFGVQKKDSRTYNQVTTGKNELIILPESTKIPYKKIELHKDKFYTTNNRPFKYNIYDMLLIQSYIEEGLTVEMFRELKKVLKTNNNQLYRAVYNLQENIPLQKLLEEFRNKMKQCTFSTKDGFICINGDLTTITPLEVQEMFHRLDNCDNKELCIYKIQKSGGNDYLHVRLICEHRNNKQLTNLISIKKEINVVNDREKRANILLNGGV
jgi:hypothetical protein